MRLSLHITIVFILSGAAAMQGAKYAGEEFKLGAGARPLSLGGAFVALSDDPSGVYYNAAGLALVSENQIIFLHSETFGSLINHDFIAYSHPTQLGSWSGSLGVGIYHVGGGGIFLTDLGPDGRPYVTAEVGHNDFLFLFGGGFSLRQKLRAGATAKVILRSLADNSAWGLGLDFGLQYGAVDGLALGLHITNLTSSFISYDNGTRETILPAATIGGSYTHRFSRFLARAIADGELLFERRGDVAPLSVGGVSLDTHIGGEISYDNIIYLRAGSNVGRMTIGVGFKFNRFHLDGALTDHKDLDNSYLLSLNVAF